jgi:MtN3 and saliva related transmembrane protein
MNDYLLINKMSSFIIDGIGYMGGFLLSIQLFPQIYKVLNTKSAKDLSFHFMTLNVLGLSCMTTYGILNNDYPLFIPTSISLINTVTLIACSWYYR